MSDGKLFYRVSRALVKGELVENRVLMHLCGHPGCTAWGAYLYGARWKDGIPGAAYCREHRPELGGSHVKSDDDRTLPDET